MARNNQNQCCALIFGLFRSPPCNKPAKMTHEGKHYCGIHDPIKKQQRREAQDKIYANRQAVEDAQYRLKRAAPEMLKLLKIAIKNCKQPDWRLSPEWFIEAELLVCKVEDRDIFGRDENEKQG